MLSIQKTIPILRIFDYNKAIAFYVDWLGFKIDWENKFSEDSPVYLQVSLGNITLHLSEHHGDGTPGSRVFVICNGLKDYHTTLLAKNYKYNRPGLGKSDWNTWLMEVIDPFANKLLFNEEIKADSAII